MKVLALAIVNSLIAGLAVARDCPTESDCMQKSCKDFAINKHAMLPFEKKGDWKNLLEAVCKDSRGKEVYTWLNLKECITENHGALFWQYQGNFRCSACYIEDRKSSDPVVMSCNCYSPEPFKINLSEGIWVDDGVIGCFKTNGHKAPIGK
ncbi:cvnh domain-containing protein [Colletotrichum sp. SAR11_240]|nr:cvnh domain-containing protein [Colletotrichum sp. SAR11_240]